MKDSYKTEERLLELVKSSIFKVMGLTLIAIPILLFYSLYVEIRLPKIISVSQEVSKEVNIENFKKDLVAASTKNGGYLNADALIDSDFSKKASLPYGEQALTLFRCGEEFKRLSGVRNEKIDSLDIAKQVEYIRSELERVSSSPSKGKEFVNSSVSYLCGVLKNPSIIDLKKKGDIGKVVIPAFNYYISIWDEVVYQNNQSLEEENARIEKAKNLIFKLCIAAGTLFGLFILLALYLMLIRIELNLKNINSSIDESNNKIE